MSKLYYDKDGFATVKSEESDQKLIKYRSSGQSQSDKMEFYKVELVDGAQPHFEHDGVTVTYAELADKYNDPKYFLYAEYRSVTFIPSLPPDYDPLYDSHVLEFSAVWDYLGEHRISIIKINDQNEIKADSPDTDFLLQRKITVQSDYFTATEQGLKLAAGKYLILVIYSASGAATGATLSIYNKTAEISVDYAVSVSGTVRAEILRYADLSVESEIILHKTGTITSTGFKMYAIRIGD